MNILSPHKRFVLVVMAVFGVLATYAWADPPTRFSNIGSVANTRHNLTQSTATGGISTVMDITRNNYGEVCVYCHTPHGANGTINAPLWNRTIKSYTYTLYNIPLISGQTPTQPGVSSLTCLSCHDGTVAIDSIVNMPGSGGYLASQTTSQTTAFLNAWTGGTVTANHFGLNSNNNTIGDGAGSQGCIACHKAAFSAFFPDFTIFNIGTDLTNDHPVGVQLPDTAIYDFNAPTVTTAKLKFYDANSNSRADPSEIRFYNTGEGYEVECSSCHDPHGVPSAGSGSPFNPTFLRVSNSGSVVCLTCHNK